MDALPTRSQRPLLARLTSPAGIGWTAALIGATVLAVFMFAETGESTPEPEPGPPVAETGSPSDDDVTPQPASAAAGPETRLTNLAEWVTRFRNERGHFPAALGHESNLANSDRLSWLAALAVAQNELNNAQPQPDRAWHDPLNDRFVRQRVLEFQNPLINEVVGGQGYPASHLAGVAGVGADAPALPIEHARAGIFGEDRLTTVEDVLDGLANTMLVVGIQGDLTSWAANGQGTLRALTAEPYIHGPDGLGTGQPDGMFVLMADGSVRFLSADADPRLMRRMAAMRDGLPLDLSVSGEPGEFESGVPETVAVAPVEPAPEVKGDDPAAAAPIDVTLAPDEPRINVEDVLALPVLKFAQAEPIPAVVLLQQLEELGGIPIDRSEVLASPAASRLEQTVSISLGETTFGEILSAVLAELELSFTSGPQGITLHASTGTP